MLFCIANWLTCVGVKCINDAKCSLSGADKYFCCLNLLSSSYTCNIQHTNTDHTHTNHRIVIIIINSTIDQSRIDIEIITTTVQGYVSRSEHRHRVGWANRCGCWLALPQWAWRSSTHLGLCEQNTPLSALGERELHGLRVGYGARAHVVAHVRRRGCAAHQTGYC